MQIYTSSNLEASDTRTPTQGLASALRMRTFETNFWFISRCQIHFVNVRMKDHDPIHSTLEKLENVDFTLKTQQPRS